MTLDDYYIPSAIYGQRRDVEIQRIAPITALFIYLPFANESRLRISADILDEIANDPIPQENFHLTLLWSESCTDEQAAALVAQVSKPIRFTIEVVKLEVFGKKNDPVLVWMVNPGPALIRLQTSIYNVAFDIGIPISEFSTPDAFIPHITVASHIGVEPEKIPQGSPFRLMVNEFIVGRDEYRPLFTVGLPRGVADVPFIEKHIRPLETVDILPDPPEVELDVCETKVWPPVEDRSGLAAILRGEGIVRGIMRKLVTLADGPFTLKVAHSRKRCMDCKKPSEVDVHWADGRGRAWFCLDHFCTWASPNDDEGDREIVRVWAILGGEVPEKMGAADAEQILKVTDTKSIKEIISGLRAALVKRGRDYTSTGSHMGGPPSPTYDGGAGGPEDKGKQGMRRKETEFERGRKKLFDKLYYAPIELGAVSDDEDFQELIENKFDWQGGAALLVDGMIQAGTMVPPDQFESEDFRERAEKEIKAEIINAQLAKWYDAGIAEGEEFPLTAEEMADMTNVQIHDKFRSAALEGVEIEQEQIDNRVSEMEKSNVGQIRKTDTEGRKHSYIFGRDDGEIVAVLMTTDWEPDNYRVGQLEQIATEHAGDEAQAGLDPYFKPDNYLEDNFESGYLHVNWLAAKYPEKGYGTQAFGEAVRMAAEKEWGLELGSDPGSESYYSQFGANVIRSKLGHTFFWNALQVEALALRVENETISIVAKNLIEREDIDEVIFGADEPKFREDAQEEDDLEPANGALAEDADWDVLPRNWRKQFAEMIEAEGYISAEDAAVLDANKPYDQRMPDKREDMLKGIRRSLENLIRRVLGVRETDAEELQEKHGKHVGQKGREKEAAGGSQPGFEHEEGSVEGDIEADADVESEEIFHGTGEEAARSIMDSGLQIKFADDDNWLSNVIYAAADRRDALAFAARSSEERYAVITIDSSLAGKESDRGTVGLTFSQDIPAEAIIKVDVYQRGFQRKDDVLIETIERAEEESSQLFIAAEVTEAGLYVILGPKKEFESALFSEQGDAGVEGEADKEELVTGRVVGPLRRIVTVRHGKHVDQEGRKGEQAGGSRPGFKHEEGSVGEDASPIEGGAKAGVSTGRKSVEANEFQRAFLVAMEDNERKGYVTERSLEELENMVALYLSEDGKAGLAILDHGDGRIEATAGFNRGAAPGIVLEMLKESVREDGVNYVEAFWPLNEYYARVGFAVDEVSPWNPEFAPDDWNEADGKPNYYTMELGK